MPDQLQSIVQKMIDAGESEETIATAIRGYKPEAPSQGQVRSRTGQMYTPYTAAGVKEFATGAKNAVVDTLNPMTYARKHWVDSLRVWRWALWPRCPRDLC